jgi:menaquinone-dependent protoporphyrinogen oxidase
VTVLVTYASKEGATRRIAARIADTLRDRGLGAEVRPIKAVTDLAEYEAFVIGSGVYFGSWLNEAISFLERNQALLEERPVWLFSRGSPDDDRAGPDVEHIARVVHAREHCRFAGAPDHMRFELRDLMVWGLPRNGSLLIEGDFRNWPEVEAWASKIADQLANERAHVHRPLPAQPATSAA